MMVLIMMAIIILRCLLVALGLHQLYAHLSDKKIFAVKVKVPKVSHNLVYFLPRLCSVHANFGRFCPSCLIFIFDLTFYNFPRQVFQVLLLVLPLLVLLLAGAAKTVLRNQVWESRETLFRFSFVIFVIFIIVIIISRSITTSLVPVYPLHQLP